MGVGIASISEHTPTPNSQHKGDLLPQRDKWGKGWAAKAAAITASKRAREAREGVSAGVSV